MKGAELPISTLVIIVLALLILLGILALFFGVWTPGATGISLEAAKNNACQMLVSTGCYYTDSIYIRNFDADKDGNIDEATSDIGECGSGDTSDNLYMLCRCWYNFIEDTDDRCRSLCGCLGVGARRCVGAVDDDGICPPGCTNLDDNDCPPPTP